MPFLAVDFVVLCSAAPAGFVAVGTFASLMGVAWIIHWDRFNHEHVAFWLWAGIYFTPPFWAP